MAMPSAKSWVSNTIAGAVQLAIDAEGIDLTSPPSTPRFDRTRTSWRQLVRAWSGSAIGHCGNGGHRA